MLSTKFIAAAAVLATAHANGLASAPAANYKVGSTTRVEVPAIPFCPDGSSYDPALGCAYFDYAEPKSECPHPYKLDRKNNVCHTTTYGESSLVCPKGGYLDGKKCVTEVTAPVDLVCKRGELTKDGCVVHAEPVIIEDKFDDLRFDCEKGFSYDSDMGLCVKNLTASADLVCPEGYELSGKRCVTVEVAEPHCPKGYSNIAGECIAVTVEDARVSCPRGASMDDKGNCVQTITENPVDTCEKGYTLNRRGKCEAEVLVTAVLQAGDKKAANVSVDCKGGRVDKEGNCFQTYTVDSIPVCNSGFLMNKAGRCEMDLVVDPLFSCGLGYELEGTECVRTRSARLQCATGFRLQNSKDKKTAICSRNVREAAGYICPKGYEQHAKIDSRCTALEVAEPSVSCRKGYELIKDQCVIPGSVIAGKDKYYDVDYVCPKGFKYDAEDGICVDYISDDAVLVCEKGYTVDERRNRCFAVHETPAQLMCPKRYTHSAKGGNLCDRVLYDRPVFKCPEGASSVGKSCYIYQEDKNLVLANPTVAGKKLR